MVLTEFVLINRVINKYNTSTFIESRMRIQEFFL